MKIARKTLFDIEFSAVTQQQSVQLILHWLNGENTEAKRVVTPNVNLTMLQKKNPLFRSVLNSSDLCLVDGKPIYWASKWFNQNLPEVVTGSDLVPAIFAAHCKNTKAGDLRVYLLGAGEGVAQQAAINIMATYPRVNVCGTNSPPFGFEKDLDKCEAICQSIFNSQADLLIIGLGAPKQEFWAEQYLHKTGAKVAICAGATIDFMAGEKRRAPTWMRKVGLEFLFRMLSEPRRLAKRYFKDGLELPGLFWAEYKKQANKRDI
jgi:N-acetylglucosaminyldiphosphoundecaprenol N-acetyl-beta-D-mannosaminyltransferase